MKGLFRKIAHVKKRRTVKKAIGLGVTACTFRFGAMNSDILPTRVDFGHYTQRLLTQNSCKKTDTDDQAVNSIRFKTGSGAVIEIQNQHNKPPEALKYTIKTRGGGFLPRWPRHRRLSPKLAPNQGNPGGGDRPRSSTTLSSKPSQSEYQPDGYSEEQIQSYRKNPRYSELAQDPQLMGQECSINPKSEEEACTVLQAENEGLVTGAERTDLKAGDPNYDYKTTTPTRFIEIKVPRDSSLKDAARLGRKSGLQQGNDGDVTLLVNLMRIQPEARAAYAKTFLEAAGGENVIFINN